MNFLETIFQTSLDNSLADIKTLSVKNLMVLKILDILSKVIFMMLLVMSILIPSQVIFCHGVQIDLLEFGMRLATVNVLKNFELLHALRNLYSIPRPSSKKKQF